MHRFYTILFIFFLLPFFSTFCLAQQQHNEQRLTIEEIRCHGNNRTSCAYIKTLLPFTVGDSLNEDLVKNASLSLTVLSFFKSANIFLEKGSRKDNVIANIAVVENSSYLMQLHIKGVYGSSNLQSELGGRIENQNFLGRGKNLSLSAGIFTVPNNQLKSDSNYLRLRFIDPKLFGSRDFFLSSHIGYLTQKLTTTEDDIRSKRNTNFNFSLGYRLGGFSYAAIGYRLTNNREFTLEDKNGDGIFRYDVRNIGIPVPNRKLEIDVESVDNLYFSYGWNTENDPYFPKLGSRLNITWQVATQEGNDNEVFFSYRKNWTTDDHLTWSIQANTPSQRAVDNPGDPTLLSGIRPLPRKGYLAALAQSVPKTGLFSNVARGRWSVDVGYIEHLGYDDLSPSIGFALRFDNKYFGIINFEARYIKND